MTSPPPYSVVPGLIRDPEPEGFADPPFSPAPIQELLRLIVKAARAHQLYLPNNPVYQSALSALRGGFTPIWAETDEITLAITEGEIRWFDAVVSEAPSGGSRSADNLPWLFYKDGIRELRMLKGFEQEEVLAFLTVVQRARKGSVDEDDLVTMLWESDFVYLQYKYVDLLQEGGGGDDVADGGECAPADPGNVRRSAEEAVEESRASGLVNMADFDATLYFLDEREIDYLQGEIKREYAQNLRTNVVAVLLDIFETQTDPAVRTEAIEDVETLMVHLLTAGDFHGVAYVLREVQTAIKRAPELTPEISAALGALAERMSAPESLSQLLQALDEALVLPPQNELSELFAELRPTALGTVFSWLGRSQNERLRPVLEGAAGRLAAANTAELVRLIQSPEPEVSAEAIRRAGGLKAQAAVLSLGKVLTDGAVERRQLAVQALTEIGSAGALQALERAIEDTDREVRITAVRALGAKAYKPVLARLEAIVRGKDVRDADRTEKMAFFETYGTICGDAGVPHLDAILNGKGFLGRREDPELRACAAIALGRIGTSKANETLQKSAAEKDIVVRTAVAKALRGSGAS